MDELLGRLAAFGPTVTTDPDLPTIEAGARRRRRRRRVTGVGLISMVLLTAVAAAVLLGAAGPEQGRPLRTADQPASAGIPSSWGSPQDLLVVDGDLWVSFAAGHGPGSAAGLVRLDPATGEPTPLGSIGAGEDLVGHSAGAVWTFDPWTGVLRDRDPGDGSLVGELDLSPWLNGWSNVDVASTEDVVWLMSSGLPVTNAVRVEVGTAPCRPLTPTCVGVDRRIEASNPPVVTGPNELWVPTDDGLVGEGDAAGSTRLVGRSLSSVTADADHVWVAGTPDVSLLEPGSGRPLLWRLPHEDELGEPTQVGLARPRASFESIASTGEGLCIDATVRGGGRAWCGPVDGDELSLRPVGLDHQITSPLVAHRGRVWAASWLAGDLYAFDPLTATAQTVIDTDFNGYWAIRNAWKPVGPRSPVAAGRWPGGGRWRYAVYPTLDGSIGVALEHPDGTEIDNIDQRYVDVVAAGAFPGVLDVRVNPSVATVRVELSDGTTLRLEPVDVGLPVNFAVTSLPTGTTADRVTALDANGQAIGTA